MNADILAIYPGSFDPLTNGHVDLILRSAHLFERILAHASIVSDGLRDLARGLPEETLAELDRQHRHR